MLCALGPVQHATRDKHGIVASRTTAPFLLKSLSLGASACSHLRPAAELTVVRRVALQKGLPLRSRQFDVANPKAHRRLGDTEALCYLPDRGSLIATQSTGKLSLTCFHFGKRSDSLGQSGRRESNSCTWGGNPVLFH